MGLTVFSIDYQSAHFQLLEKLTANKDDQTFYLTSLMNGIFFTEMVIISTCNRVEWVFLSPEPTKALSVLMDCIKTKTNISTSIIQNVGTVYNNDEALSHLFELTAGLKSMVLGENEILAQIKESHSFCLEFGTTGPRLNKIFQSMIAAGKQVRATTNISKGAHSISSIAIEAIKHSHQNFLNEPILLIGAGVMVKRAIAKLTSLGHKNISISNRTMSRVEHLSEVFDHLSVIPYASIRKRLQEFSTIYVAISSKSMIINCNDLIHLSGPMVIVDLGMPRNVDPECSKLAHIKLFSIPQLEEVSNATLSKRSADIPAVLLIIQDAISDIKRWEMYRNQSSEQWVDSIQFG